ncbi:hypothetical protein [Pseudomonas sp. UBA4194]|uniref:hypothetical protein n=1 Tax=Pseudomonas sp. UBA4194 TaxID=1947317 RepID=UPI0025FEBADB|nr:hypothetical protein [Pseudomonas sp. UBA4194]
MAWRVVRLLKDLWVMDLWVMDLWVMDLWERALPAMASDQTPQRPHRGQSPLPQGVWNQLLEQP